MQTLKLPREISSSKIRNLSNGEPQLIVCTWLLTRISNRNLYKKLTKCSKKNCLSKLSHLYKRHCAVLFYCIFVKFFMHAYLAIFASALKCGYMHLIWPYGLLIYFERSPTEPGHLYLIYCDTFCRCGLSFPEL